MGPRKEITPATSDSSKDVKLSHPEGTRRPAFRPFEHSSQTISGAYPGLPPELRKLMLRGEKIVEGAIRNSESNRDSSLEGHCFLTDAGNIVKLDLRAKRGPSFTKDYEQHFLEEQGYAGKVEIIT